MDVIRKIVSPVHRSCERVRVTQLVSKFMKTVTDGKLRENQEHEEVREIEARQLKERDCRDEKL